MNEFIRIGGVRTYIEEWWRQTEFDRTHENWKSQIEFIRQDLAECDTIEGTRWDPTTQVARGTDSAAQRI